MKKLSKLYMLLAWSLIFVLGITLFITGNYHVDISGALLGAGVFVTNDFDRAKLENFLDFLRKYNNAPSSGLSDYDIRMQNVRLVNPLVATQNTYKFDLANGYQGVVASLKQFEVKAPNYKVLFPFRIRACVRKLVVATGQFLSVRTYEDPLYFTVSAAELAAIGTVFNGTFDFATDNQIRITQMANEIFRVVPETQSLAGPVLEPSFGPDQDSRGYGAMNPVPLVDTTKLNYVNINLMGGPTVDIAGSDAVINVLQVDVQCYVWDYGSGKQLTNLPVII